MAMRSMTILGVFSLLTMLSAGSLVRGEAVEHQAAVMLCAGHVKAITIHTCGLHPGGCQGTLVLVTDEGDEISVAIMPPMRVERGEQVVTMDAIAVGDYVRVQGP
jgi:hypothetical protein